MRISDISIAYCKANDLHLVSGRLGEDDPAPILSFLIMDCAFQEFDKKIKPLDFKHSVKRAKNDWLETYHRFNSRLFVTLGADLRDFAIDLMDAYADAVDYEQMLIRVAVMDLVRGCEFEHQQQIASLMLCDIFSQVAQISWGLVYKTFRGHNAACPELSKLHHLSHRLANSVVLIPEHIDPNASPKLHDAVQAFMDKTSKWLKSYDIK